MIYLDYSSTTPVLPEVLDSFNKVSKDYFANPNSLHSLGEKSKNLMNGATKQISELLKISEDEVIYTSGSTESNNMAIIGLALAVGKKGSHIVTSKMEHESIYEICSYLEENGFVIDYVNNDDNGVIDFEDLKKKVIDKTILVTISAVNSEVGIRQPLKTIKQVINKENPRCVFHSDMTQAIGKVPVNLADVDMASFDSQKIYGVKGVGMLYKSNKVRIKPLFYGSKKDIRPGTPPLPLIASFSKALRISLTDLDKKSEKVKKYNDKIAEVKEKVEDILDPEAEVTKADVVVLTAITNIVFNEEIADSILAMKDAKNEDDEKKAADAFQSATINEAMKLLDVVAYVPSDMASGILGVLDSFMTSSGK